MIINNKKQKKGQEASLIVIIISSFMVIVAVIGYIILALGLSSSIDNIDKKSSNNLPNVESYDILTEQFIIFLKAENTEKITNKNLIEDYFLDEEKLEEKYSKICKNFRDYVKSSGFSCLSLEIKYNFLENSDSITCLPEEKSDLNENSYDRHIQMLWPIAKEKYIVFILTGGQCGYEK